MVHKIDHIGIAVPDAQAALSLYRDALGLELTGTEDVAQQKLTAYHLRIGETHFELLEPREPDSVIAKFLEKRGPGIHHIALAVDDIHGAIAQLRARGLETLGPAPTTGAGGKRVIFFHPRGTGGVLLELCQDVDA